MVYYDVIYATVNTAPADDSASAALDRRSSSASSTFSPAHSPAQTRDQPFSDCQSHDQSNDHLLSTDLIQVLISGNDISRSSPTNMTINHDHLPPHRSERRLNDLLSASNLQSAFLASGGTHDLSNIGSSITSKSSFHSLDSNTFHQVLNLKHFIAPLTINISDGEFGAKPFFPQPSFRGISEHLAFAASCIIGCSLAANQCQQQNEATDLSSVTKYYCRDPLVDDRLRAIAIRAAAKPRLDLQAACHLVNPETASEATSVSLDTQYGIVNKDPKHQDAREAISSIKQIFDRSDRVLLSFSNSSPILPATTVNQGTILQSTQEINKKVATSILLDSMRDGSLDQAIDQVTRGAGSTFSNRDEVAISTESRTPIVKASSSNVKNILLDSIKNGPLDRAIDQVTRGAGSTFQGRADVIISDRPETKTPIVLGDLQEEPENLTLPQPLHIRPTVAHLSDNELKGLLSRRSGMCKVYRNNSEGSE